MANHEAVSSSTHGRATLGIYVYGASAIALGLIGLAWRDFAVNWQHVQPSVPHRVALAIVAAVCEILGGAALFWRPTARAGAALLTLLFAIYVSLWMPEVLKAPGVYDNWGNFFEELSAFLGGLAAFALLAPRNSAWADKEHLVARIYGICPVSFGLVHFIYLKPAASFVPTWIPPGQTFWAVATAIFFLMAAAAILSGILAVLAARLLTAMIIGFELLAWLPRLIATPHNHFLWSGNAIGTMLGAAAWVVADALATPARAPKLQEAVAS